MAKRGYWGDIKVGPYIGFGIDSENKELFKRANKMYTHSSQHVAEYNILSMFYELANNKKYEPPNTLDKEKEKAATESKQGPTLTGTVHIIYKYGPEGNMEFYGSEATILT